MAAVDNGSANESMNMSVDVKGWVLTSCKRSLFLFCPEMKDRAMSFAMI
jgi:hypothetical protein